MLGYTRSYRDSYLHTLGSYLEPHRALISQMSSDAPYKNHICVLLYIKLPPIDYQDLGRLMQFKGLG
jgi:hypothetical protein